MDKNSNVAKVITESLASADLNLQIHSGSQTAERLLSEVHQELCKLEPADRRQFVKDFKPDGDGNGHIRAVDGSDGTLLGMRYQYSYDPTTAYNRVFIRLDNCDKK